MAVVASPCPALDRKRHAEVGGTVRNEFVQFAKTDVKRLALRTLGLLVLAHSINVEGRRYRLTQNFIRRVDVLWENFQLNAAERLE